MENNLSLMPRKSLIRPINNNIDEESNISLEDLYPAPTDWNFYGKISVSKMDELIKSILDIGMLHPIVVWEIPNENNKRYMILSGHNRVKAYNLLNKNTNDNKYSQIKAIVKKRNDIDENIAKQIIIDTNWIQRELTPIQKAKSILRKYTYIKSNTNRKINVNQIIGQEYNLQKKQIINYKSLLNLIEDIQPFIDNGKISIKAGVKISKLEKIVQKHIFDKYINQDLCKFINSKSLNFINKMTIDDIELLLNKKNNKEKIIVELEQGDLLTIIGSIKGICEIKKILSNYNCKIK